MPVLRLKECEVQNGPIAKNGVLPLVTLFFFENLINSWFKVPITQMPILIFLLSVWVVSQDVPSLWVSLNKGKIQSETLLNWTV